MIIRITWLVVDPSGVTNVGGEITAYYGEYAARKHCEIAERKGGTCTLWRVSKRSGIPEEVSL